MKAAVDGGALQSRLPAADVCVCFCVRLSLCEKEEQHANTSANYDVELLHHRDAHMEFIKSGECY